MSQSHHKSSLCYCPTRWLLAHHDADANLATQSSHMCLANFNNDGENLLALVDFKRPAEETTTTNQQEQRVVSTGSATSNLPFQCKLLVYRGQQLIYSHFLQDVPSALFATSIKPSSNQALFSKHQTPASFLFESGYPIDGDSSERALLSITINDDVYFYHKLKPSHRLSLEDDESLIDSINKSEYEAWQMVKQKKVDVNALRELLGLIASEFGAQELTSHSNNFLSLETDEERKNYLLLWKFKRLENNEGEHLMSMDTICCAGARLKFSSSITLSGDFGQTRETGTFLLNARWNKLLDIQRDGLVLGTEDRHLLIYELRLNRAHLEYHYKLPSTPDNILVERRSPDSFNQNTTDLRQLTYKLLVSCRNCRVYSIEQRYLCEKMDSRKQSSKSRIRELVKLKCNVLQMCWSGDEPKLLDGISYPNFVVACLDRRVYCFSSLAGQCQWVIEVELPVTCIISLPLPATGEMSDRNLIGVASQAERVDFFVSSSGRIVDTIYFNDDHCQSMTFGRFGREDNCLCLTTNRGHLAIFILKRTAKFAHGQCLSSAAAYAKAALINYSSSLLRDQPDVPGRETTEASERKQKDRKLKLDKAPGVPSAFKLHASSHGTGNAADQAMELLQEHNCEQVLSKSSLDARLTTGQLQVPPKGRDFVDQIVEQSRRSTALSRGRARRKQPPSAISKTFVGHLGRLREQIRNTIERQPNLRLDSNRENGNAVTVLKITGLGNTYRVSLSLRLNLTGPAEQLAGSHLLSGAPGGKGASLVSVLLFPSNSSPGTLVKPFRFELFHQVGDAPDGDLAKRDWILERTIQVKLFTGFQSNFAAGGGGGGGGAEHEDSISLEVYALLGAHFQPPGPDGALRRPLFISSVNIATC